MRWKLTGQRRALGETYPHEHDSDAGPVLYRPPGSGRASRHELHRHVDLASFGLAGQLEQVWLHDLGDGGYALACIPFMVYGLALGDVVRLSDNDKVVALAETRGQVLRLMLVDDPDPERLGQAVDEIKACIASAGLLSEWHGPRFVAVDVPSVEHPGAVYTVMGRIVEQGRGYWEWADARPFAQGAFSPR